MKKTKKLLPSLSFSDFRTFSTRITSILNSTSNYFSPQILKSCRFNLQKISEPRKNIFFQNFNCKQN
jgi:hypothetical protein